MGGLPPRHDHERHARGVRLELSYTGIDGDANLHEGCVMQWTRQGRPLTHGRVHRRQRKYTNEEFWKFIAPWNEDLPYVYDSYSNWTACEEQGISFFTEDTSMMLSSSSSSSSASSLGGIF